MLDLIGKKFGKLTVIKYYDTTKHNKRRWWCICDCGNEIPVVGSNLVNGNTKSCNCLQKEYAKTAFKTHGFCSNGIRATEYMIYHGMLSRCYNPNFTGYENYGGRGIIVCDRWLGENGFVNFYADMGKRPSMLHTLDRYPNNETGIYEQSNCRWATDEQQSRNKRTNVYFEKNGVRMIMKDWANKWGISPAVIDQHIKEYGKTFEDVYEYYESGKKLIRNWNKNRIPDKRRTKTTTN